MRDAHASPTVVMHAHRAITHHGFEDNLNGKHSYLTLKIKNVIKIYLIFK